jgi:APA family basic amino acid/polyamine antiporter
VLGCVFVLVGDPDKLIRFVGFTLAVFAGLAVGAVFILRARGRTSQYKTTGYPVTPLVFIALSVWIAYAQIKDRPFEALAVGVVLAVGALVYWLTMGRKPPVEEPDDK